MKINLKKKILTTVIGTAGNTRTSVQLSFFLNIRQEEEAIFDDQENDGSFEAATCYLPNSLSEKVSIDKVQVTNVWEAILHFVVFFPLGDSPASEFYMPTFRTTLFHLHRSCEQEERFFSFTRPTNMEQSVPKSRHIKFRAGESPKRKNTTFRTWRKFVIQNDIPLVPTSLYKHGNCGGMRKIVKYLITHRLSSALSKSRGKPSRSSTRKATHLDASRASAGPSQSQKAVFRAAQTSPRSVSARADPEILISLGPPGASSYPDRVYSTTLWYPRYFQPSSHGTRRRHALTTTTWTQMYLVKNSDPGVVSDCRRLMLLRSATWTVCDNGHHHCRNYHRLL